MMHPALLDLAARDRISELRRAGAERSIVAHSDTAADANRPRTSPAAIRDVGGRRPRQALGRFLVRVGLRLAGPRSGAHLGR
jgi:hypothetical protein